MDGPHPNPLPGGEGAVDPITTEIIKHSLIYAAEEMGIAIRNAAYSPNIKERLDHSCALFDAQGRMVAQAEHIPVHLGSLPWGLKRTLEYLREAGEPLEEGDMVVLNNPYIAGTHLNDVTVIRPIFFHDGPGGQGALAGYAASKAHHTDIGGKTPGSMPADAHELYAEGLIIPPVKLVRNDGVEEGVMRTIRVNSRTPDVRLGDLKAQMAGNFLGERRLREVLERYGRAVYEAAVERLLDDSERRMRHEIATLPDGEYHAEDCLDGTIDSDDPIPLRVTVRVAGDELWLDYTGTSPQVEAPLNAVLGVTLSTIHYSLRCVTDQTIAMNEGCFRPLHIHVPEGTLLNPRFPAAVSGGNVETSMRGADLLLRAFAQIVPDRVPAACGGTMSNVMVGATNWAFYETIATGMGGRPGLDGLDAIHCNMTNTLNTPVETIERYIPVRMTRYEFREGSGGPGRWRGGCGVVRAWRLTAPWATLSVQSERVTQDPWPLAGGKPGWRGRPLLRTASGEQRPLRGKCLERLAEGDEFAIQSPGGAGFGDPLERDPAAVLEDVANGIIDATAALHDYGVVLTPPAQKGASWALDLSATQAERMRRLGG